MNDKDLRKIESVISDLEVARASATTDLVASYQRSRDGDVGKSYRQLVDAEIRKGCSPEVAAQRVTYSHPHLAQQSIAKSATRVSEFMTAVDKPKRIRSLTNFALS